MIQKLFKTLNKVGINGFLLGIFLAIFLGYLLPELGSNESSIPWKPIINVGIGLVFFFYGVKLDPVKLKEGLVNWKLHVLIQSATYIIFPGLILLLLSALPFIKEEFKLGITYLSVLPSTVSASVVMVSIAGGNLPGAIFNASISSLIGVVLTPAWMGLLNDSGEISMEFLPTLGELSLKVLLPVFLGVLAHQWLYPKIASHIGKIKYLDQSVIMIIVFTSFAQSFSEEVFAPFKIGTLVEIALIMLGVFFLIWGIIFVLTRLLKFSRDDQITALFCGSKKSLVQGVVIGKVIFPDPAVLALAILPLMLYHIQQLIAGSIIASSMGNKSKKI
ncbi:bile acid:sodium symporter family protein [Algoriphagus machipongonensis]|uniref:Sodium bile acid symporter family protein n=1 Tax=Algoriphagus machipongonensis TaxID=388413 RepID=A3I1U6_9BACT|nr:bile acid:sodium symporter family protein [Algoriphagus machipongonensis]EAZ79762.1 sodium bile acid symporter family protein [Algoriphagus machipongonensis]